MDKKKSLLHINHSEKLFLILEYILMDFERCYKDIRSGFKEDEIKSNKNFIKTLWSNEPSSWNENLTPKENDIFCECLHKNAIFK